MTCVVRFQSSRPGPTRIVEVPRGTRLLEAVRLAGLPLARGCRGAGLCGRCGLRVLAGGEALPQPSPAEERAKARNRIPAELRLACQLELRGPLEVTASYW